MRPCELHGGVLSVCHPLAVQCCVLQAQSPHHADVQLPCCAVLCCVCCVCCRPSCPTMLNYNIAAENGSMYNTPPCWPIYICGLVFKHLLKLGGLAGVCCVWVWRGGGKSLPCDHQPARTSSNTQESCAIGGGE
mgnify:FL=1